MKSNIGIDIDGVLCDHVFAVCHRILEKYGISIGPEAVTGWDFDFGPSSIAKELEDAYKDEEFLLSLPLFQGAQEGVSLLAASNSARLVAITSRPADTEDGTNRWLREHFPGLSLRYSASKLEPDISVLLDDSPNYVQQFAASGRPAILFSRPWNQSSQKSLSAQLGIRVADGWPEAVLLLNSSVPSLVGGDSFTK